MEYDQLNQQKLGIAVSTSVSKEDACMENKRPVTFEDLWRFKFVGDPEIAPDGSKLVWVQTEINADKNTYESAIWMSAVTSEKCFGEPVRITYGKQGPEQGAREGSPRFSPDGNYLAFVSNRSGKNHIWLLDMKGGGEARQVTQGDDGVSAITWSPDGKHLAFISREPKKEPEDKEEARKAKDVTVVTKLRYKANGVPYIVDPRPLQLFMVDIESGEKKQLTFGEYDCSSPAFSPDGRSLAFISCREPDHEVEMVPDIWVLTLENGELTKRTDGRGPAGAPVYSPDGKFIAFFGNLRKEVAAAKSEVLVIPVGGGDAQVLTAGFDRSIGCSVSTDTKADAGRSGPYWSHDSKFIYFIATDRGYSKIFRVSIENSEVQEVGAAEGSPLHHDSCVCGCGDAASQTFEYPPVITSMAYRYAGGEEIFAFTGGSELNPGDIYAAWGLSKECVTLNPSDVRVKHWQYDVVSKKCTFDQCCRLTSVNEGVLSELLLSKPEPSLFTASDGVELEGWLMKPVNFEPGKKYPAVLEIHGGPAVTYGLSFFHEFQLLTSNGFGVFYCNPRGSLGYGEWFAQQVIADQGGMDYQDIMSLRDYMDMVEWVDSTKVGVTGGSYGGYMTNWIVGHTDRFHAAVTQRSISNWYTKYGTSDIGFYGNRKGMGMRDLWDSEGWLMERSPIRYVQNVNTPVLIIHSEQDYRCPMEQAEQWYIALKRLGKTVEFARFAGESHELSRSGKPWNRRERLRHILRWFDKFLK